MNIHISIDKKVTEEFADYFLGGIVVKSISKNINNEKLTELIESTISMLDEKEHQTKAENSIKYWRRVYQRMNVKPSKYLCSFESLYKRTIKTGDFFRISPLVDFYNIVSLKHGFCAGGYDLEKLAPSIDLRFARPDDSIVTINSKTATLISSNSVVYSNKDNILCMLWNHRDADFSKITKKTEHALFFIDSFYNPSIIQNDCINLINEIFNPKKIKSFCLNKNNTSVHI